MTGTSILYNGTEWKWKGNMLAHRTAYNLTNNSPSMTSYMLLLSAYLTFVMTSSSLYPRCKEVWQSGSSKGTRTMKGQHVTIREPFPSESAATRTDGKCSQRCVITSPPSHLFSFINSLFFSFFFSQPVCFSVLLINWLSVSYLSISLPNSLFYFSHHLPSLAF